MNAGWEKALYTQLAKQNKSSAKALCKKYAHAFSSSFIEDHSVEKIANDIFLLEKLSSNSPLQIHLYKEESDIENPLHLRLYQWKKPLPLSTLLPMLESLGLFTCVERLDHVKVATNQTLWINDFGVSAVTPIAFDKLKNLFIEAFTKVYSGDIEIDGFNKLVLNGLLSWQEICILRTYAKYLRQICFRYSQAYIEKTLNHHITITQKLIALFHSRFNLRAGKPSEENRYEKEILTALSAVTSLDEDKILRQYLALIKATERTNYYQLPTNAPLYFSIKLNARAIPDMPLPVPLYEIFVYSTQFEAIHLRNTKVARGGIRWSERPEDFRTEILGLMKAQKVKNAVIVPSGAKGGFVVKNINENTPKEITKQQVILCYQSFMHALLDLTDNVKRGKIIPPKGIRCHDEADTYLVVAADKGTASFSDIANAISIEKGFWLGDAFASGGKTGYDHKKIGITARGAWESIKRHFLELNIDAAKAPLTIIGIGDMSGDVFGNGLLYSKHCKLLAAFDHRHIFLDPTPDPLISYKERLRLYQLAGSSWEDYNAQLISKGGGVFKRSSKSIKLSAEVKQALSISEEELTPNDLIRAILKAPLDLLYNGGIGTYVKASTESHSEVGDRTNDYCRINGNELRCKVVGEGGNLGFTQRGRIEYALNGGRINTDFIDNSAGVDCSDHEVNLKILLSHAIVHKKLSLKERDRMLKEVTQEVTELVLKDNYAQALVMGFSNARSKQNLALHHDFIKELESVGLLDRQVEFLPDEKKLIERKTAGQGLTSPEIAVLLAYSKIHIKNEILKSSLPDDASVQAIAYTAFPASLIKKFSKEAHYHELRRDIIATQLSNQIVNAMGITFVYRLQNLTGAGIDQIVRAFIITSHIFQADKLRELVLTFDSLIPLESQYGMLFNIRHLLNISSRWFLTENRLKGNTQHLIEHYAAGIKKLEPLIPRLMTGATQKYMEELIAQFIKIGLPKAYAQRISSQLAIYTALNIIEVSTLYKFDLIETAKTYFYVGNRFNLVWLRDYLRKDVQEGLWNILSQLSLRDELDSVQRTLTISVLKDKTKGSIEQKVDKWINARPTISQRWEKMLALLHSSEPIDYAMLFVAIRELLGLTHTCMT